MHETFTKSIQGHQLEFKKECCTNCYQIFSKHEEQKGLVLSMLKDEKGFWTVNTTEPLPAWFNEISMHVHLAIEAYEAKEIKPAGFQHFDYLF